jgi:hypothetical protein
LEYVNETNVKVTNDNNNTWEPKINGDQRWWVSHEFRDISDHEN